MALQHLRSGTANKRPLPTAMSDGQLAVNTNLASPGLFFKDSNGDLVKVGPVHIGSAAPNVSPASTAATALVANTIYKILTVGTSDFTAVGASANTVGVVFTASGTTTGTGTVSGEQGNEKGEMWLDNTGGAYDLKIYDGTAWRSQAGEFVNATGDTMTGDLLFNNANIVFEGSAADDHETTLTVVNPTADRTITLPNVTGTVVTTGDTGSVTSTMITDGTIVNADVNASAAIAGTKVSPNFGSQAITTTGIINANGKISFPLGSQSAPSLLPGSDTNTGIFSPGADQIAITTGGTTRFSVGNLATTCEDEFNAGNSTIGLVVLNDNATEAVSIFAPGGAGQKTTLNSDGSATFGGAVVVFDSTAASKLWIKNGASSSSQNGAELNFGNTEGTGSIKYNDALNKSMLFYVDGHEIMRLKDNNTTAGNTNVEHRVGIGTSDPRSMLDVEDGAQFVERSTVGNNDPRIKLEKVVTGSTITGKITTDNLVTTARVDAGTDSNPVATDIAISAINNSSNPTLYLNNKGTGTVSIEATGTIATTGVTIDAGTSTASRLWIKNNGNAGSDSDAHLDFGVIQGDAGIAYSDSGNKSMTFKVDGYEIMRLKDFNTTAGSSNIDHHVGIGTASPGKTLSIGNATNPTLGFYTGSTLRGELNITTGETSLLSYANSPITFKVGSERMRIDSSGRVGIGTGATSSYSAIADNLLIAGSSNTGMSIIDSGDSTQSSLYFYGGTTRRHYIEGGSGGSGILTIQSNNAVKFNIGTAEKMRIDSSGKVGIGTSAPSNALHVKGVGTLAYFEGSGGSGFIGIEDTDDNTAAFIGVDGGSLKFQTSGSNFSDKLVIDSAGRLLVGTTNAVAFGSRQVLAVANGTTGGVISLYNSTTATANTRISSNPTGSEINDIGIHAASTNGSIIAYTNNDTERMRIDSSGRLLVGTSTSRIVEDHAGNGPQGKIQIEGTNSDGILSIISAGTADANRSGTLSLGRHRNGTIGGTPTIVQNGDSLGAICFAGGDGTDMRTKAAKIVCEVDGTPGSNDMPGRLLFSTTAAGASSPTGRMRIGSGGKLTVPGVYSTTTTGGGPVYVESDGDLLRYTSSLKYKADVETIDNARADAILSCRPVWYRSKCANDIKTEGAEKSDWGWYGFIAEELAEIEPRLVNWATKDAVAQEDGSSVSTERDPANYTPEGVRYDNFVPLLVNLVKRQQQAIETLEQRLSDAGIA